jgi:hypothetical protein
LPLGCSRFGSFAYSGNTAWDTKHKSFNSCRML